MPDIKAALTKKVGPLPLGVWIATVGVGLYVLHKRMKSTPVAVTPDTTAPQANADQTFPSSTPPGYVPNYGGASGSGYYDSGALGSPQIVISAPAHDTTKTTWQQKLMGLQQSLAGIAAQLSSVNSRLKSIGAALRKAKPGTTQYQTLLNEYRAELSKRDALTESHANTAAQIPIVQSQLSLLV